MGLTRPGPEAWPSQKSRPRCAEKNVQINHCKDDTNIGAVAGEALEALSSPFNHRGHHRAESVERIPSSSYASRSIIAFSMAVAWFCGL